ncbi:MULTISPECIES: YafY family protein [unclassified Microbacterium]|uniref:helix-turn-helix transcriptional regulator n=1 Tax=unclassified Microbacterium TaxID=2609290 RepID=UPI000EA9010C|nr:MULTISPECIES: WYL domain-containing protein [unclassified Microbacterium]MBT2485881.1 WYL domain-containing protein [Microbacterium sp. ISL-108]RKN68636.1 WYL domain-containing protein [Microbacterium sp. CGR2]
MAARIPAEERLTNLVVALMATEIGLTKQQILDNVSGYRQRADAGARSDALEKMFERDKEELRSLGVPIETLGDVADPNDLREARYRIPQAEYDLPSDIEFTAAEMAVLRLAGSVWSAESASGDAQSGVRKIRALGIDGDEPIIGFAPRITARDAAFSPLQEAIEKSRVVVFDYLKPGESVPRRRSIRPLALVDYEARWHVFGVDVDVNEDRTFLLSRIVGDVKITTKTFDPSLRDAAGERALAGLEQVAAENSALLEITPGTEAALRLGRRATPAAQGITVPFVDLHIFADELASYGPEVRVVEPALLREAVIARLQTVVDAHQGGEEPR